VFPEDSAQFTSHKIWFHANRPDDVSYRLDAQLSKAPAVRTTCHIVRTHIRLKHHPSERVGKLRTAPACICPNDSAARPDYSQCLIKLQDFFPKPRYGKIVATIWTRSSIRRVSQFKSRRSDASHHGPNTRVSNMEIVCIRSTVRTTILLVLKCEASIWKLLAVNVQPFGRQGNIVKTRLSNRKDFQRNFQNFDRIVVRSNSLWPLSEKRPVLSSQTLI
jgi:hypothetical protein